MKFTLKNFQLDAVSDVLANLKRARDLYGETPHRCSSFSLTATTGAGKTVMAAAAIEALFWGNDMFDFEADSGAVVLWFSDDPSLNAQTFHRLREASEKFSFSNLVHIDSSFSQSHLNSQIVYFINTQKLSKSSLLTRGHSIDDGGGQLLFPDFRKTAADMQNLTIWEMLRNTMEREQTRLYLIVDEAHRGFNAKAHSNKPTIVRSLINGTQTGMPIPIVWGISATIEKFETEMEGIHNANLRRRLPSVNVDPLDVQESGLIKDIIVLDTPRQAGKYDTVLLRRGAQKLQELSERWAKYCQEQEMTETVQPLMIFQVPNTPSHSDIGVALDAIFDAYPDMQKSCVKHVFGEHGTQIFGAWHVDWIDPQRIQTTRNVRVVLAKDAISTGWDCPRAEVLVSFRRIKDVDHITQLLGRMVRTPLARRVLDDERLNAVDCILPFFDRRTAKHVVSYLTGNLSTIPGGPKKVVFDPVTLYVNKFVQDEVLAEWCRLPRDLVPRRHVRPIKRLLALGYALAADDIFPESIESIKREIFKVIDGGAARYEDEVRKQEINLVSIKGQEIRGEFGKPELAYSEFLEEADERAVRFLFEKARKIFGPDLALAYVDKIVGTDDGNDDRIRRGFVRAIALANIEQIETLLATESSRIAADLFARYRLAVKELSDEKKVYYDSIREMNDKPQKGELTLPTTRIEDRFEQDENEENLVAPLARKHLLADQNGDFPLTSLNKWERIVLSTEMKRPNLVGWYRNPPNRTPHSLSVSYMKNAEEWRTMHPDFIFFHEVNGKIVASIVDPHGFHLSDALEKLKGLSSFASRYIDQFHRIESIAVVEEKMRVLDLKNETIRKSIDMQSENIEDLFRSPLAQDYILEKYDSQ